MTLEKLKVSSRKSCCYRLRKLKTPFRSFRWQSKHLHRWLPRLAELFINALNELDDNDVFVFHSLSAILKIERREDKPESTTHEQRFFRHAIWLLSFASLLSVSWPSLPQLFWGKETPYLRWQILDRLLILDIPPGNWVHSHPHFLFVTQHKTVTMFGLPCRTCSHTLLNLLEVSFIHPFLKTPNVSFAN